MDPLAYKQASDFFNALSHPTRVEIVAELLKGKKCVGAIRELTQLKQPNVSQHLFLLRLNKIVDWHQEGKRKCYFLVNPRLIKSVLNKLEKNQLSDSVKRGGAGKGKPDR